MKLLMLDEMVTTKEGLSTDGAAEALSCAMLELMDG